MIDTVQCKEQQLVHGYYQSGSGPTEILILGSCRTVPYINYLVNANDGSLTIRRIDPCDFAGLDLGSFESDPRILDVFKSTKIFIHEYLINYGMFNTGWAAKQKDIYQFGMRPEIDIKIPNFNDHLILEHDYTAYGAATPDDYVERGEAQIEKFCDHCDLSSFPDFTAVFRGTWRAVRYFWRPNHVSSAFTKYIFKLMNEKFLKLNIGNVTDEDLFRDPHTPVTQRDRESYGITW